MITTWDELFNKYKDDIAAKIGTTEFTLKCIEKAEIGSYSHYVREFPFGTYEISKKIFYQDSSIASFMRIARFSLAGLPGCCGVAVSKNAHVDPSVTGKGLGTLLQKMRMEIAAINGYSVLLCTDVASNEPQNKVLAKNGWAKVFDFTNKRTGNVVNIHVVNLVPEEQIKYPRV